MKIISITNNVTNYIINLQTPLKYFHYGSKNITVSSTGSKPGEINIGSNFGVNLDMRAGVGHITRNIKIRGS